MRILVTGAYGMLGTSLQKMIKKESEKYHLFYYLSSKECDLRDIDKVESLFHKFQPQIVIHLASCVGGVYQNMNNNYNFIQ